MIRRVLLLAPLLGVFLSCTEPPPVSSSRNSPRLLADAEKAMLLEQYLQAAGMYEAFLIDNPNDFQRAEIRAQAGKCRLAAGQPEQAIRAFDQALSEQPSATLRWEILFRRALAYRTAGDASRAVEGFRAVAAASPADRGKSVTNDELHYEYALALFRAGDFRTGQLELRQVNPRGPYEKKLAPRLDLSAFTVQVGAFGDESLATAEAAKLRGRLKAVAGDRVLFLVLTGSFSRYDEAQREAERLQRQGYTDAFVLP